MGELLEWVKKMAKKVNKVWFNPVKPTEMCRKGLLMGAIAMILDRRSYACLFQCLEHLDI